MIDAQPDLELNFPEQRLVSFNWTRTYKNQVHFDREEPKFGFSSVFGHIFWVPSYPTVNTNAIRIEKINYPIKQNKFPSKELILKFKIRDEALRDNTLWDNLKYLGWMSQITLFQIKSFFKKAAEPKKILNPTLVVIFWKFQANILIFGWFIIICFNWVTMVMIGPQKWAYVGLGEGRSPKWYQVTHVVIFWMFQGNILNFDWFICICFNSVTMVMVVYDKWG